MTRARAATLGDSGRCVMRVCKWGCLNKHVNGKAKHKTCLEEGRGWCVCNARQEQCCVCIGVKPFNLQMCLCPITFNYYQS